MRRISTRSYSLKSVSSKKIVNQASKQKNMAYTWGTEAACESEQMPDFYRQRLQGNHYKYVQRTEQNMIK